MIEIGSLKISRRMYVLILALLALLLVAIIVVAYLQATRSSSGNYHQGPPVKPSTPGVPTLQTLEQVTDQAYSQDDHVPNSWGVHKDRIIRTSTGDLFTVYTSQGPDSDPTADLHDRTWHVLHRAPNGGDWQELQHGDAGTEPINIVRGPHDEIHIFAWPGTQGQLDHWESTDLGKTFTHETIPGQWTTEQGYSSAGMNDQGDIVFFQSGDDTPGRFLWTYYSHTTKHWQFHISKIDQFRYTYAFFFPGDNNDLTMVGVRDVKREELGYAASSDFDYIFNAIKYFRIGDANNPDSTFSDLQVVQPINPRNNQDADITYLTDSYIDTQGRTHILYYNQYDQATHHIVVENGQLVKDVPLSINDGAKSRIIQDTQGHFYIIAMDQSGNTLNIYPGSANDTDGTQLNDPVKLDISKLPGCTDFDFCHPPTFTVPRNGHALSDTIDGTYGNYNKEIYFRIQLRGGSTSVTFPGATVASISSSPLPFIATEKRAMKNGSARSA